MNKLYKIFVLLISCLFLFGFKNIDEKYTINPNYVTYENMTDEEFYEGEVTARGAGAFGSTGIGV